MRYKNRWLAAALVIAVALGDCCGMTAFAAENALYAGNTVSENTMFFNETPETNDAAPEDDNALSHSSADHNTVGESNPLPYADTLSEPGETDGSVDIDGAGETEKTDRTEKLPALHIGQISDKEALPSADDDTFIYDRPVSFETGENLILFVNYDLEAALEYKDAGALEWSILRGEKGVELGSASLLDKEDDWDGFETVLSSPYFIMEEMTDAESECDGMMTLVPEALSSVVKENPNDVFEAETENYDYYIRAAYYLEIGDGKAETFYSAATVPFLPKNDADADTDQTADGSADAEEAAADPAQDGLSVSENSTAPENSADAFFVEAFPEDDALIADKNSSATGISMPAESTVLSLESEKADVMSATLSCGGKTASVAADVVTDAADSGSKLLDLSKEIRVAGFERESDKLVYTGQQVRQNLRVYYKENLLTEKTDYTLTYRNNTNAT